MCISVFKRFVSKKKEFLYFSNASVLINPTLFNRRVITNNGKVNLSRSIFFFHNKTNVNNLFLYKKIKPRPILRVKKKK